jgi:hypothetical protein
MPEVFPLAPVTGGGWSSEEQAAASRPSDSRAEMVRIGATRTIFSRDRR